MDSESIFQTCISAILEHEGGLTDDHNDPGGITNWGISLRFLLDAEPSEHPTEATIKSMTKDQAIQLYRTFWWDKFQYAKFTQLMVVEKVFDLAVNMGNSEAVKLLQTTIDVEVEPHIAVDGILGDITFHYANCLNGDILRQGMRGCAAQRYKEIVQANPAMERYLNGWLNRAEW